MKTTVFALKVFERINLPNILPESASYERGVVIRDIRKIKEHGHGKIIVEIRDRKIQMIERTLRTAFKA